MCVALWLDRTTSSFLEEEEEVEDELGTRQGLVQLCRLNGVGTVRRRTTGGLCLYTHTSHHLAHFFPPLFRPVQDSHTNTHTRGKLCGLCAAGFPLRLVYLAYYWNDYSSSFVSCFPISGLFFYYYYSRFSPLVPPARLRLFFSTFVDVVLLVAASTASPACACSCCPHSPPKTGKQTTQFFFLKIKKMQFPIDPHRNVFCFLKQIFASSSLTTKTITLMVSCHPVPLFVATGFTTSCSSSHRPPACPTRPDGRTDERISQWAN